MLGFLFVEYHGYFTADIPLEMSNNEREEELLRRIHEIADRQGGGWLREVPGFPVPHGRGHLRELEREDNRIRNNFRAYGASADEAYPRMNGGQKSIAGEVVEIVQRRRGMQYEEGELSFLEGEAGTGKSFMLDAIRRKLESGGMHVAMTAATASVC